MFRAPANSLSLSLRVCLVLLLYSHPTMNIGEKVSIYICTYLGLFKDTLDQLKYIFY